MKKHEFISSLDVPEIIRRIALYAKPAARGYSLVTETLFYRMYDDHRFWLVKTPSHAAVGQPHFCADISVDPNGIAATIRGRFAPTLEMKMVLFLFSLLAPIVMLSISGWSFLVPAFLFWFMGMAILYVIFDVLAPVFWKKEQAAVLAFIEERLLS